MKENDDIFLWKFGQMSRSRAYSAAAKGRGGIAMHPGETAIRAGNTVGWYDTSDTTTITKDGSNLVQIWWDKIIGVSTLGTELSAGNTVLHAIYKITACQDNYFYTGCKVGDIFACPTAKALDASNKVQRYVGNHLSNFYLTIPTAPPELTTDGILFNGTSNYLSTAVFTYNQPEMAYMVIKQLTWTSTDYILDGGTSETMNILQYASTPHLSFRSGTLVQSNNNLAVNTWGILRVLFSGASSKLQVNGTTALTGNTGATNAGGITIAKRGGSTSNYGHIQIKEMVFRNIADDSTTEGYIYDYLKAKYSL